jgi:TPR repeat protein
MRQRDREVLASQSLRDSNDAVRLEGWHERSAQEGEHWLRKAANGGDTWAMEKLAYRLLGGIGLSREAVEGERWLRRAVAAGDLFAMEDLGNRLIDGDELPRNVLEGRRWLGKAATSGNRFAMVVLGIRLVDGDGVTRSLDEGERWLVRAAERGSNLGMAVWGLRLARSRLARRRDDGERWLFRAGANSPDAIADLASHFYIQSLSCFARGGRRILTREVAALNRLALSGGSLWAAMNLAYLVRRGEISGETAPSLDELLAKGLSQSTDLAILNQALRLARGIQCTANWRRADRLILRLGSHSDILPWWSGRAREGDAEGHLVVGWLVRHQLALDPDGSTPAERMQRARAGGWPIPAWMDSPARHPGTERA